MNESHQLHKIFGSKFSLFQEIYQLSDLMISNINSFIFPPISEIDNLIGYKIKYNTTHNIFYLPNTTKNIMRIYDYKLSIDNNFNINKISPLFIIRNKETYQIKSN